ncbi:hypothetical protein E1264_24470 [Actinomadura sp. KC216]|uniref:hypothetical protein n=1 Tax=Actinomadura sp. KC216 TaxID=2530370 RepID=UPI001044085F|nr:hypothetical protein [Actinomadura sp. KC216]TDB84471.1 hypothetical protein E1264_24470 [Actinomadura sp. KC216]
MDDAPGIAVAAPLQAMLIEADFARTAFPPRHPPAEPLPCTVSDLTALLKPVTLPAERLLSLLVNTCTRDLAYDSPGGPWNPETARSVFERVLSTLGPRTLWWSNNDFSYAEEWTADGLPDAYASTTVTGYVLDRVLLGSGAGVLLTILAFADD